MCPCWKSSQIWVCINEIAGSRSREVVLPPLFYGCKTSAESSRTVHGSEINPLDVQKQAQRQTTAIISMPEHMTFQERQKKVGLFRLKRRRPRAESCCCLRRSQSSERHTAKQQEASNTSCSKGNSNYTLGILFICFYHKSGPI